MGAAGAAVAGPLGAVGGLLVYEGTASAVSASVEETAKQTIEHTAKTYGPRVAKAAQNLIQKGLLIAGATGVAKGVKGIRGGHVHTDITSKSGGAIRADAIPNGSRLEYLGPGRVKFDGVEFRAVRDLSHLSDDTIKKMSKTGVAPRDIHGEILEGHHHKQQYHRDSGAFVVQIPESFHSTGNVNQHPLGKNGGIGTNTAERKDWNRLRTAFHKALADNEKLRRGIK
ncbi:MAG: hypothetical protein HEEMFOPI_01983 [Holosporales bacterium]